MMNAPLDTPPVAPESRRADFAPFWVWAGLLLAVAGSIAFLALTPPGLLAKIDVIASAVCHRIASHSFFIHEHQLPLCQRCTGTFPGALTGLLLQWGLWRRRTARGFPRWTMLLVFAGFAAVWGLDGFNSYTTMLLNRPEGILGYAPQPWLRLLSGVLMGAGMSAILAPAFNQTFWADGDESRVLRSWHELALLVVIEVALAALILMLEPWLLYPVSLYSAWGVLTMFVTLGAMIFVMLLGRDRAFTGWRTAWLPLVWGFVFALAVIGVMSSLRFIALGTVNGVPGLS
ncbi:MAG TPA: DUF2085 domain-containing protein [Anaerolineae bacterium]|nr:DUF2085 domain-containing protein [Anaerolineae bacterium]